MAARGVEIYNSFYKAISADLFLYLKYCNFKPTWQQAQLCALVMQRKQAIAVKSGQGPGKTAISGLIASWRLIRHPGARTVVVAPTVHQAKDVWLKDLKKNIKKPGVHSAIKSVFSFTGKGVGLYGNKPADWGAVIVAATAPETTQGHHDDNLDVIFEEASGISREIAEQFEGTLKNPSAMFLKIGNPNTRTCEFFDCFNIHKNEWSTLTWNAEETPESRWFTQHTNVKLKAKYGYDSDYYRIRVLGEFPKADPATILSMELLERCFDPKRKAELMFMKGPRGKVIRQFGIDLARFGGDENTIFARQGYATREFKTFNHMDPNDAVRKAFEMQTQYGWDTSNCIYVPDASGIGQGVMSTFYENGKKVHEFHNGGKAFKRKEFDNKITEAWFGLKDLAKAGKLWIPNDARLVEQLTTRIYMPTAKGLLAVESKDQYKKRGFLSPDRAEGLAYSFYEHAATTARFSAAG